MINYIPRKFTVIRDKELCINCGCCVRQCSNECHYFDEDGKTVLVNSKNCVACHRCVDLCPTGALRIEKYVCDYRDNANWTPTYQQEICRQADTGSVLLLRKLFSYLCPPYSPACLIPSISSSLSLRPIPRSISLLPRSESIELIPIPPIISLIS